MGVNLLVSRRESKQILPMGAAMFTIRRFVCDGTRAYSSKSSQAGIARARAQGKRIGRKKTSAK